MSETEGFAARMGVADQGSFSMEEVENFLRETLDRFPDREPEGIRASWALVRKGLGEAYLGLTVSPQPSWWPGEVVELQFRPV